MMRRTKQIACWQIRGYDSTTKIFDELIPAEKITQHNLKELLRSLVGRGLSSRELVSSYAKRNTRRFNDFLQIRKENDDVRRRMNYYCGHNPHYAATLISVDQPVARAVSNASESS